MKCSFIPADIKMAEILTNVGSTTKELLRHPMKFEGGSYHTASFSA